ncbi:uncharacterized protein LOC126748686 [Anthonomus grandis grandis]|uniref:uncharacterized protein LOC126748686 n=1 Tax=Anthonomus grandis grandis TaxID=2921223 RepID=UPI002166A7AF|nr:uncharacterized protein LOC126748686 [Anthonomus grandis grandis]
MCFVIDVTKHSTEVLCEYYSRISRLLAQSRVVQNLPDHGTKLRYVRRTLIREMYFRGDLGVTMARVLQAAVKSASDTLLLQAMRVRRCSTQRRVPKHRAGGRHHRNVLRATDSAPTLGGWGSEFDLPADVEIDRQLLRRSRRLAQIRERRQIRERAEFLRDSLIPQLEMTEAFEGVTGSALSHMVSIYVLTGAIVPPAREDPNNPQPGPSGLQNRGRRDGRADFSGSDDDEEMPPGRRFMRYGGDEEGGSSYI